jgi:hypothetical protein
MRVRGRPTLVPAIPYRTDWDDENFSGAPAIDEHGPALRAEFPAASGAARR